MTCSKNFGRLLQVGCLGLIGTLAAAGCGGSESPSNKDSGTIDGGGGGTTAPKINSDQVSVTVGSVDVGKTSAPVTVNITNVGNAVATLTVLPSGAGIAASGCTGTLAPAQACVLSITAAPSAAGAITGSVSVSAASANTVTISVGGTATLPGNFAVSPSAIPLGTLTVGQAVQATVTVTANAALTGLTTGVSGTDLKLDPSSTCQPTLAAGASCTVVVDFTAPAAGTLVTDSVVVSQDGVTKSVPVSATVVTAAKLGATPATAALVAAPGMTSSPLTINVGNTGGASTGAIGVALSGTNKADFTIVNNTCVATLAAGGVCSVTITYSPAAAVTASEAATLTITDQGPGASVATVTLSGTPNLPSSLAIVGGPDLGSVAPGATGSEVIFTVTNSSSTPSGALTASVSDAIAATVTISSNTCATKTTLNKGDTCTIGLKLTPPSGVAAAAIAGLLTVTGAGGSASASVTGTIVTGPALSANPLSVNFGSVPENQSSSVTTVTITNTGATATGTLSATLSGSGAAQVLLTNNCTTTLAPAKTCSFAVKYNPTDTTGVNGAITVTDGSVSATIPMVGTGLAPANFTVSQGEATASTLNLGSETVGYTTGAQTLTVAVPSGAATDSGLISAAIAGANAADFAFKNNCAVAVVPGASCTITVSFTPSVAGAEAAVLTVTGAKGGTWPVQLSGTGLALVELDALSAAPTATPPVTGLDFGSEPNGTAGNVLGYSVVVRGASAVTATSTVVSVALVTGTTPDFRNVLANGTPTTSNLCDGATLGLTANTGAAMGTAPTNWSISGGFWTCTFYVQFYPQTGKSTTAKTATVNASATGSGNAGLSLTGLSTGPLVFDPNTYTFSAVTIGQASESGLSKGSTTLTIGGSPTGSAGNQIAALSLVNKGAAGVTQGSFTIALGGTNAGDFGVVSDQCTPLTTPLNPTTLATGPYAAGTFCVVEVVFAPGSVGSKTATLTATAASGETATATLLGTVNQPLAITVSPNVTTAAPAVSFGSVAQGNVGTWMTFTILNPAGAPTTGKLTYSFAGTEEGDFQLYTLATAGVTAYPAGFCGDNNTKQLNAGESCVIQGRFAPTNTAATGTRNGTLTVANAGTAIPVIPLTGTATSQLTLSATTLNFGNVAKNATATQSTTITNVGAVGTTALTLTIPSTIPGTAGTVSIANSSVCTASTVLAAGQSCRLDYQYQGTTPGTIGTGTPPTLLVTITSNLTNVSAQVGLQAATVNPAQLALYGFDDYGLSTGNPATGSFTPTDALNFGNVLVGSPSGVLVIWFTNTGDVPATGINATVTANSDFAIPSETGTTCNTLANNILPPQGTCSIPVQLTPTTAGNKTATLTLAGAGGLTGVQVTLNGSGHGSSDAGVFADLVTSPTTTFATIGSTAVGASPGAKVFYTLHNNSVAAITFSSIVPAVGNITDFTVAPEATGGGTACSTATNGIAVGATCQFSVTFAPTTYSGIDTSLDGRRYRWASVNFGGQAIAGVIGQVQKPAKLQLSATSTSTITVTPSLDTVNFGQIVQQSQGTLTFTITNIGEGTTAGAVTAKLVGGTGGYATLASSTCGATLAANATCTATVNVSGALGVHNDATIQAIDATVTNHSEDSADIFTLIEDVVAPAALTLTGAITDFGPGTAAGLIDGTAITITVHNGADGVTATTQTSGALAVSLSNAVDFTLTGGTCYNSTTSAYIAVTGGTPCTIVVQFNPQTAGAKTTTLSVGATPGGTTQTLGLTGTGLSDLLITPAGTATTPAAFPGGGIFVVTNSGSKSTQLLRETVGGTNAALFVIVNDSCFGQSLPAGDSCQVSLDFLGTASATAQTATLTVSDGTANNSVTAYTAVVGP